ncbi:MAG: hypothetical protein ACLR6B_15415 [Blautia sp.]
MNRMVAILPKMTTGRRTTTMIQRTVSGHRMVIATPTRAAITDRGMVITTRATTTDHRMAITTRTTASAHRMAITTRTTTASHRMAITTRTTASAHKIILLPVTVRKFP